MVRKIKAYEELKFTGNGPKRTSIGKSKLSRPKNKHKKRITKRRYRGQGSKRK